MTASARTPPPLETWEAERPLWFRMVDCSTLPTDLREEKLPKRLQIAMAYSSVPAVGAWGLSLWWLGHPEVACMPFAYCLATLAMIAWVARTKDHASFRQAHPLLVLLAPYAMHWYLGGFAGSGSAAMWSIMAPLSATMFLPPDQSRRWIVAFVVLIALAWFREVPLRPDRFLLSAEARGAYTILNTLGACGFAFLSTRYFVDRLEVEQERSERLLRNILPAPIADRLKREDDVIADRFEDVTVLFSDLVGFTGLSARMSADDLVVLLDEVFSRFDALADRHGLEKIKTIGDAYMVVGGVPEACDDHAQRVAAMALEMIEETARFAAETGHDVSMRVGVHSGEVVAGVIGRRKFAYDLWGDTVNVASRMESHGEPGRVQVSSATAERLGDAFGLERRGAIQVKGKGEMVTYWLTSSSNRSR